MIITRPSKFLFSVVIPTYHRNDLLARCLDRLAPNVQTLAADQYEVIVSDDGYESTAEDMIRQNYPWVKWVAGPRKGPAANRNNGAKYAQGEWLVFTDDDCLPDPQWLATYAEAIALDIQVYEGKTTCEAGLKSPLEYAPTNLSGGYLWSCNMMIAKGLFLYLGGFDANFPYPHLEDVDLRERILANGNSFKFIDNCVVDHPPRRLPWGNVLGAAHESSYYYWQKKRNQKFSVFGLLFQVIRLHLSMIARYPISLDSLIALMSLLAQVNHIVLNAYKWHQKYPLSATLKR